MVCSFRNKVDVEVLKEEGLVVDKGEVGAERFQMPSKNTK